MKAGFSEEPIRRRKGLGACGAGSSRPHALYSVSDSEGLSGRLGLRERAHQSELERLQKL